MENKPYRFNDLKAARFSEKRPQIEAEIKAKKNRFLEAKEQAKTVAEVITQFDGKVCNRRVGNAIDKRFEADRCTRVSVELRPKNSYQPTDLIEITIKRYASPYSYNEYEQYIIICELELDANFNYRIKAETLAPHKAMEANEKGYDQALSQIDQAIKDYNEACEVADRLNNTSHYLRDYMEQIYICGLAR